MGTFKIYEEEILESDSEQSSALQSDRVSIESEKRKILDQFDTGENAKSDKYSDDKSASSVTIQIEPPSSKAPDDNFSIASSSSFSSSSSSTSVASVMVDPGKKQHFSNRGSAPLKVLGPANANQNRTQQCQPHPRIRRVPSTANPKYKIPKLGRSHSQPQLQFPSVNSQRRNSSPSTLNLQTPAQSNKVKSSTTPNSQHYTNQNKQQSTQILSPTLQHQQSFEQSQNSSSPQQQQQQIIYLQIPQPSQSQMYDPQALQQQISSQLQLLVPQIYSQLFNEIQLDPNDLSSNSEKEYDSVSANFSSDVQSQRMMNQIYDQNHKIDKAKTQQQSSQPKRQQKSNQTQSAKQSNATKNQSGDKNSTQISAEDISKYLQIENISQILQQIPSHILQQNSSSDQTSFIEIQQMPGYPKITIPITQELLLHCQQFQQQRDIGLAPYQPRLETILEESLSVKHLKITKYPKTKIIACILTVLCVVVVVLLAGDKTVAVVAVAVVFIVFLLASIFYLYINSSKSHIPPSLSHSDSQRIQVSAISASDNKPTSIV